MSQPSTPIASESSPVAHASQSKTAWIRSELARECLAGALVVVSLAVAGQFYLAPASSMLWAGDRGHLMSNGGDATSLPFFYDVIRKAGHESVRNLMYGSILNLQLGPPNGYGMWVPWIERWIVVILGRRVPVEAAPTAFVWILMVLAGFSFYVFARLESWPRILGFAFALAYAFSACTRARAVVHPALVAIYCLPLTFVALRWIKLDPRPARVAVSALLLLLSMWTAHYYILMLLALAPLFVWFQLREDGEAPLSAAARRQSVWWRRLLTLTIVVTPAVAFLAWNYLRPLVPGTLPTAAAIPPPDQAESYMRQFAARPIDYFTHDLALGPDDLIPLRRTINESVFAANFDGSNVWERANGIRWSILFPFLALMLAMCVPVCRRWLRSNVRATRWKRLTYWSVFAALTFWCSLSPESLRVYEYNLGASGWVHAIFPAFRVPCRFAPFFHFGVLAVVGTYAAAHWQFLFGRAAPRWRRALPCLLPVIMVLDYSPLQPVLVDDTRTPRFDLMAAGSGHCGVGIHFPYSPGAGAGKVEEDEMYPAFQQLRETNCQNLQQPLATEFHTHLLTGIGTRTFSHAMRSPAKVRTLLSRFVRFANCAHLDWVLFRERVPDEMRVEICDQLHWKRIAADACTSPEPRRAQFADPAPACTSILEGG